jgi:cyclopropane-fatty-acyl-phospholipid synthase
VIAEVKVLGEPLRERAMPRNFKRAAEARLPLLGAMLRRLDLPGELIVIAHDGRRAVFGQPGRFPRVVLRLHDRWLPVRIALNPALAVGEAWMRGRLTIVEGDLRALLDLVATGAASWPQGPLSRLHERIRQMLARTLRRNGRGRSVANVAHHYDLSERFYRLFLDYGMHYSCGYFRSGKETLEEAQRAKVRHIAAKLCLAPGQRVLDVGSGWGGMALDLAEMAGVQATGVTLSTTQCETAVRRARESGLGDRVRFAVQDYREVTGTFDRVVSVGMFEHVGTAGFGTYFKTIARVLEPDGVALVHAIGRWDGLGGTDDFTDRYIFPGGYIPAMSEVLPAIERSGLIVTDIEILRLHYALTLGKWYERFQECREDACNLYGEEFCRMWEFYLAAAETSFRHSPLMVFQLQLAKRRDAVPLTRDYVATAEMLYSAGDRRAAA